MLLKTNVRSKVVVAGCHERRTLRSIPHTGTRWEGDCCGRDEWLTYIRKGKAGEKQCPCSRAIIACFCAGILQRAREGEEERREGERARSLLPAPLLTKRGRRFAVGVAARRTALAGRSGGDDAGRAA
eukprot:55354-Pleurochrysis_carterae.AAC.2